MVDVVVPIHNIKGRGYWRVFNCLSSLSLQKQNIGKVIIVDSSESSQVENIRASINWPFVKHVVVPAPYFNKPKLYREALKHCESDWILLTDCDYLFSKDMLDICKQRRGKNILHKKVLNVKTGNTINPALMDRWSFRRKTPNEWGTLANGALQYASRSFFNEVINEVPEYLEMSGWGAMDNIMTHIAYHKGYPMDWIGEGEILHQFHRPEKWRTPEDKKRFYRNQDILTAYKAKYNIPELLSKDG